MNSQKIKLALNDQLSADLTNAVVTTLNGLFEVSVTPEPTRTEAGFNPKADLAGVMSIIQEDLQGQMLLTLPKQTVLHMLTKCYRREFTELDKSAVAAVGELTNIVFGSLKTKLNERGLKVQMQIPSVLLDRAAVLKCVGHEPVMIFPFMTPGGPFHIFLIPNLS